MFTLLDCTHSTHRINFQIPIAVSDGVHSDSTVIRISVVDTSSSKPTSGFRFPFSELTASVKENTTYKSGEPLIAVTAVRNSELNKVKL